MQAQLVAVIAIARAAGDAIMGAYSGTVPANEKADGSPLTVADMLADQTIAAGIAAFSDLPIVSEESAQLPYEQRRDRASFWLVDPLDGTREFIARNGEFTVNIALITDGAPVLGVVYAPALDRMYWAARGLGAFIGHDAASAKPLSVRAYSGPLRVAVSRSHAGDLLPAFLACVGPHEMVPMGSSLKICLVAEGKADLYPRLGTTSEWDIAAAQCILEEAGGTMVAVDGAALTYNNATILNPWFFAARDPSTRDAALAAFAAMTPGTT
jgi:3'(2'), 5'-bisphosphate nucleotidase